MDNKPTWLDDDGNGEVVISMNELDRMYREDDLIPKTRYTYIKRDKIENALSQRSSPVPAEEEKEVKDVMEVLSALQLKKDRVIKMSGSADFSVLVSGCFVSVGGTPYRIEGITPSKALQLRSPRNTSSSHPMGTLTDGAFTYPAVKAFIMQCRQHSTEIPTFELVEKRKEEVKAHASRKRKREEEAASKRRDEMIIKYQDSTHTHLTPPDFISCLVAVIAAKVAGNPLRLASKAQHEAALQKAKVEIDDEYRAAMAALLQAQTRKADTRKELSAIEEDIKKYNKETFDYAQLAEDEDAAAQKIILEAERTESVYKERVRTLEAKLPVLKSQQEDEIKSREADVSILDEKVEEVEQVVKKVEDRVWDLRHIVADGEQHANEAEKQRRELGVQDQLLAAYQLQGKLVKRFSILEVATFTLQEELAGLDA